MKAHIFLDNSNIFGGAQRVAAEKERVPWKSVRIDYKNLFRLLRYGRSNIETSMLAGSVPPGNDALWAAANEAGFDTTLLHRVKTDTGKLVEQSVDEAIHLRISNIIIDNINNPGILVVATGDGAQTDQGCSFTDQINRAIRCGWIIEVWSWRSQLSRRLRDLCIRNSNQAKVMILDG